MPRSIRLVTALIAVLAALGLALAQPTHGGVLRVATADGPPNFDSHVNQLRAVNVITFNVYDTLLYLDNRDRSLRPALATEWTFENDTTLHLTLRADVTFHNDAPFTAEDVRYTFERIQNPDTGSYMQAFLAGIAEIEVIDDLQVRLHLDRAIPGLLEVLSIPQIYSASAADTIETRPVGTGPFMFESYVPNDLVRLVRNPDYWDAPRPYLDALEYRIIQDADTRIASLQSGAIDVVLDVNAASYVRLRDDPSLVVGLPSFAEPMEFNYINNRRPPFDDFRMRQALAYAFPSEEYLELAYRGLAVFDRNIFAPGHWANDPTISDAYPHDPELAAELMTEAGWILGGDGVRRRDGEPLTVRIVVLQGFPEWLLGSEVMQQQLNDLGAQATVDTVDVATWIDILINDPARPFDVSWDNPLYGASEPLQFFSIPWSHVEGPRNILGMNQPEFTALVAEANAETDQDRRQELYHQAASVWNEQMPGLTHGHRQRAMLWLPAVLDFSVPYGDFVDFRAVHLNR
jgi:ABC-type transport system substrate-binding protein